MREARIALNAAFGWGPLIGVALFAAAPKAGFFAAGALNLAVGLFLAKTWARIVVIVLHALWVLAAIVSLLSDGNVSPVAVWPVVVLLLATTGRNRPAG